MKNPLSNLSQRLRLLPGLDWVVLGLGLIVFTLLVLHSITASSIWFDEAFSAYISQFSFVQIAHYTSLDVHPPLYYWVLKLWTHGFGQSALAFRSLSLVFGLTTISAGFLLVKRLFGRQSAWTSLLLLVISPMLIRYGQEARMYTMVATIAVSATYVLSLAVESNKRRWWVLYGVLVSLGMWTHYFTALVWLAHWIWRAIVTRQSGVRGKKFVAAFFTKNWLTAHLVAIGLFLPWLPFMLMQLTGIQGSGFWIGPVSVDSLTNYTTNLLFYLEHGQAEGWYSLVLAVIITILAVLSLRLYRSFDPPQRRSYLLLASLATVPVLLLFIVSLPPLKSSFVERYLLPSVAGFSLFAGVTIAQGMDKLKVKWRLLALGLVVISMLVGITNVYYYGNYNKNGDLKVNTGELVQTIQSRGQPGIPIIAQSPWIFFEAIFYNSPAHPVYFIDSTTQYNTYGSFAMLKDSDQHKIKDLAAFARVHKVVWYIGNSGNQPLGPPVPTWKQLQNFLIYDKIDNVDPYKAVQFQTN